MEQDPPPTLWQVVIDKQTSCILTQMHKLLPFSHTQTPTVLTHTDYSHSLTHRLLPFSL